MKKLTTLITTSALLSLGAEAALVAHYEFDNNANLLEDSASPGYDLNTTNGSVSQGTASPVGGAGSLSLDSDTSSLSNNNSFTATLNDFTTSMWFNMADANKSVNSTILSTRQGGGAGGFLFWVSDSNRLEIYTYGGGKYNTNKLGTGNTNLTLDDSHDNTWMHVAASYDSASQTVKTYLNGALINTYDYSGDASNPGYAASGTSDLAIGSQEAGGTNFMGEGMVDDLGIWDEALSDSQINTIFTSGVAAVPEPTSASLLGLGGLSLFLRRRR